MSENKSIGGALVDVFDAGVSLVKTEVSLLARRIGNIAKAKGLGVVLLLGAVAPLTMALIFLILAVFYGLMRLGLGAWAAALIIALVSFALTGLLVMMGLKKLTADVKDDTASHSKSQDRDDHSSARGSDARAATAAASAAGHRSQAAAQGDHGTEHGRDGDIMDAATREQHERERELQRQRAEELRLQREREQKYVAEHGIPVSTKPTFEEDTK